MKLSYYAQRYLLFIGLVSIFQLILGANLIVLGAIDLVCAAAVIPLSRKSFDPTDLLYFSLCQYYGTFSLILKTVFLQPVQMNLVEPHLTCELLVGGFAMITVAYFAADRFVTRHYPGTRLRRWTIFESSFANEAFLAKWTLPFSLMVYAMTLAISIGSHSVQEVANGLATSGGLAALGNMQPLLQLALAMQLSLMTRRGNPGDKALVVTTLVLALGLTILNNQKVLTFLVAITCVMHIMAYKIRINARLMTLSVVGLAVAFFYISPVIHIVRGLGVEKSDRIFATITILGEAHFNPFELQEIESKMEGAGSVDTYARDLDYLRPNLIGTDRFTLLMPIDQIDRSDMREPLGVRNFIAFVTAEALPKSLVGQHALESFGDRVAWQFSVRGNGIISRPALGVLGMGYGVAGTIGVLVVAPIIVLILFLSIKLSCNGSIWQNPWAVFISSQYFFYGESDMEVVMVLLRVTAPILMVAYLLIFLNRYVGNR